MKLLILLQNFIILLVGSNDKVQQCSKISSFHYICERPDIDPKTQQPRECTEKGSAFVTCRVSPGIQCSVASQFQEEFNANGTFRKEVFNVCDRNSHLHQSTALLLSIFFGFLGVDRFYLGYYAIGMVKLFSLGGLLILYLMDIILIALKIVGPADGSRYLMPYYGPHSIPLRFTNETYGGMYSFSG